MEGTESELENREARLDAAAACYFDLLNSGEPFVLEQWLAQYPDLADELRGFLRDLNEFQPGFSGSIEQKTHSQQYETLFQVDGDSPIARGADLQNLRQPHASTQRYLLKEFLAEGGMGEVWLAEDSHVGRLIALKKIRDPLRNGRIMEERFLVESQIMGQLEHPCIVPLHDLGRDKAGDLFAIMKLVQGCSLKQRWNSFHSCKTVDDWTRQVEFLRLLEAFVSICRAVAYAHSRGVLHRDIKPDNIMLGNYGEALLLDWGLAKTLAGDKKAEFLNHTESKIVPRLPASKPTITTIVQVKIVGSSATQAGTIMGSPVYMSPEIASGNSEEADERTDIYLLGATLYEILTGQPPRTGSSRLELIELAQHTPPSLPRRLDHRIPKALEAICMRAMAHQIDERYESATALAMDIEHYLAGEPIVANREPLAIRCWRWCRRHRKTIQRTSVSLVLFLLMGLVPV